MKYIREIAIVILTTISFYANAVENSVELLEKGDKAYASFDNRKALAFYQKAYQANKDDFKILKQLTSTYNNLGEEAKNGKTAEAFFLKALKFARELVKKHPKKAESYFLIAAVNGNLSLYRSGRGKALAGRNIEKYAKKALELNPDYSPAYVVLGVYYREVAKLSWFTRTLAKTLGGGLPTGTLKMSEKMLRKAVDKRPREIYPNYQLAITLQERGKRVDALKYYRIVTKLPVNDHQDPDKKKMALLKIKELTK